MIHSMTAYARKEMNTSWGTCIWEIRSVNQRFLECQCRLPEAYRAVEPALREKIRQRLQRGKVEISLRVQAPEDSHEQLQLNQGLVTQLMACSESLQQQFQHGNAHINLVDLMRWPGVLSAPTQDQATLQATLLQQVDALLEAFLAARQREGQAMAQLIEDRLDSISTQVSHVNAQMPDILKWQEEKLRSKLAELQEQVDAGRIEQELVILAQKLDVAEEMDRLHVHIQETKRILKKAAHAADA